MTNTITIKIKIPDRQKRRSLAQEILTNLWHEQDDCELEGSGCVFCRPGRLDGDPKDEDQITAVACLIEEILQRLTI